MDDHILAKQTFKGSVSKKRRKHGDICKSSSERICLNLHVKTENPTLKNKVQVKTLKKIVTFTFYVWSDLFKNSKPL